ncbi:Pentatricopeptide repeat-containing protein [Abeliophyllum distichum]|uniref:Pentatricopeptide repeat-containing protein n=1 Tax=Abeliophyllum distichum TaxID=126358 RepID=A0ABD1TJK5_9LAMI
MQFYVMLKLELYMKRAPGTTGLKNHLQFLQLLPIILLVPFQNRRIHVAIALIRDCLAHVTSSPMEFKYTLTIIHVCTLNNAGKHGTIEDARKVFASMRERKFLNEADVIVYDEILVEHMKKEDSRLGVVWLKFLVWNQNRRQRDVQSCDVENVKR